MPTYNTESKPSTSYGTETRPSEFINPVINQVIRNTINSVHQVINSYREDLYKRETVPTTIYSFEIRPN